MGPSNAEERSVSTVDNTTKNDKEPNSRTTYIEGGVGRLYCLSFTPVSQ